MEYYRGRPYSRTSIRAPRRHHAEEEYDVLGGGGFDIPSYGSSDMTWTGERSLGKSNIIVAGSGIVETERHLAFVAVGS